jgi:hypothetical protein
MKSKLIVILILMFGGRVSGQNQIWIHQFQNAKEIEYLKEIDSTKVLVGTFDLTGTAWSPSNPQYNFLDMRSGELLSSKKPDEIEPKDLISKNTSEADVRELSNDTLLNSYNIKLPESFSQEFVKARYAILPDRVIVYNQKAVMIFSRPNGEVMLSTMLYDNDLYNLEYLYNKKLIHNNSYENSSFKYTGYYQRTDPNIKNYDALIHSNENKIKSDKIGADEKSLLISQNKTLLESKLKMEKFDAVMNLAGSVISVAGSVFSNMVVGKVLDGRSWISDYQFNAAKKYYNHQLQFPYFTWFSYNKGWKIHLINCNSLAEAVIPLGAANGNHLMYGCGNPFFKFSEDGRSLFTFYFKQNENYNQSAMSFVYSVDLNYLSMVKIDLTKEKFVKLPIQIITKEDVNVLDKALFDFILARKPDLVESVLKQGANPNSTMKHLSPLIVAASTFQPDVVGLLLENGADATIDDVHGWVPWHYAAIESFNSTLVDKLGKAFKKKSDGKPWKK